MIRNAAGSLAGYAASDLLDSQPDWREALAANAFTTWHGVLRNCAEELAAALAAGRPQFFTAYAAWMQSLLTARGLPAGALASAVTCLAKVLAAELPAGASAGAVRICEEAVRGLEHESPTRPRFLPTDTPHGRLAASYLLALLEGDRSRASRLILDALPDTSLPELYLQVLLPAQQEVGRMWQADEINVAEEHFATSTTKMVLAQLRSRAALHAQNGKTLLAAAVTGNQHDVGLQMVADVFEMAGWRVIQLGPDMPIPDLVQAVESYQPDLLALSVSLHPQLVTLAETIRAVRSGPHGAGVKILVGGRALADAPDLARQLGADGYATDLNTAVAVGQALVGLHSPGSTPAGQAASPQTTV